MTKENHYVKESDIRPARPDGTCFYCYTPLGQEHKQGCVIRRRTVIVRVSFDLLKNIPEDWDKAQVEFHLNESSSCSDNLVRDLADQLERMEAKCEHFLGGGSQGVCMCNYTEGKFLREATQEDEDIFGIPE